MALKLKRVYDEPAAEDGARILVDRLWPRGLTKAKARIDEWRRDLAPSDGLRKHFCHDVEKWPEFQRRYKAELRQQSNAIREIAARAKKETVTLLFGAKDVTHNNAAVLFEVIKAAQPKTPRRSKPKAR